MEMIFPGAKEENVTSSEDEEIEIITIQKTVDPVDFRILSPKQPILIVINDGVLPLFIPVIEYAK